MNSRLTLFILLGLTAIAALLFVSKKNSWMLERGLPLRIVVASENEAWALAGPTAVVVLGTGSMAPYIPAAPAGADPLRTVCALAILAPDARYTDITSGALCIYTPNWAGRNVIHQAAKIDGDGWVMTGLANRYSESGERVTASNFVGIVARTYVWQPILP